MLLAIHLGVIVLFLVLGILFSLGKGAMLIAGYNTAPKREKARYDEKGLCKFMGKLMFALAGAWLFVAASALLDAFWLLWVGYALFLIVVAFGIIYANTGNRFKK